MGGLVKVARSDLLRFQDFVRGRPSATATRPLADFNNGVVVNVFILILLFAPAFPTALAVALLAVWNVALITRAIASLRHWIIGCTVDGLLIKAFTRRAGDETYDLIGLELQDIASLSATTVEIIWPRTRPTLVGFLRIKLEQDAHTSLKLSYMTANQCDASRERFVEYGDDSLFIQWKIFWPALETFLKRIRVVAPGMKLSPAETSAVDLRRFWSLPEEEQRNLLARVKQLGYGAACVIMLTQYKHMSTAESIAYVACLHGSGAEESGIDGGMHLG
jgi:hypothetical protein